MGNDYLILNVIVCGINDINNQITKKLFPERIESNIRKIKKDEIFYKARIFRGRVNDQNNLNRIKEYLSNSFEEERRKGKIAKNVLLCFPDENLNVQNNANAWVTLINNLNDLPELIIPFIIFLSYGEIEQIRNCVYKNNIDIFGNFKDKRKIKILRLSSYLNDNNNNENNDNILEFNFRKIFSYLWNLALILNQKPFKKSKMQEANFFAIRESEPPVTIKFLLTGFSRKGKSTFINMVFEKIVTFESPSFFPVTENKIEFLYNSEPEQNGLSKGGLTFIDIPGLIEGTTDNISNIKNLINESIRNQEYNFDVINYVIFFLYPQPNFMRVESLLNLLNSSRIKTIFIINRDQPLENNQPNVTKQTLMYLLKTNNFNNLLSGNNGNNIIEVDLIRGTEGRINEIFSYIYNDLIVNNRFSDRDINYINNCQINQIFPYLRNHSNLFSRISSVNDLIERGNRRANLILASSIALATAVGFSPIPLIDVPIFLMIYASLIINIFKAFGFTININFIKLFFTTYYSESAQRNEDNNRNETFLTRLYNNFNQIRQNENNEITQFTLSQLIKATAMRLSVSAVLGALDFIPLGFIAGGIINFFINTPFLNKLAKETKEFARTKILNNGGRENVLNLIDGYKKSFRELEKLSNRNDWSRKIEIINE